MSTTPLPADLHQTYVNEANAYVAGAISLIANVLLIFATYRVKTYSNAFRWIQYYVSVLRLLFSMVVVLTSPTLVYVAKMKSLYIVKGGFFLPFNLGIFFLTLFVFFVVISCGSPTVQYLQLVHVLSDSSHKRERFGPIMSTVSVVAGIPTLVLVYLGYTPSDVEHAEAKDIVYYLNGEGDSAFLMITSIRNNVVDWSSIFCTVYIMVIMILSVITVVVCGYIIQKQMKKKMMSDVAKKAQNQINLILFLQFALPFLTVHVPFYVSFILPMFDIENHFLSNNLPFLFSWCPAINPILVMIAVKVRLNSGASAI
ncbi:CBN-SRM-2 protein [Caenorhabditis brenneri]|uniref:CBN-SRM-2 protein n=1 Tax=Caenorhabditis brenneri TaxID=135651 RepID=G0NRE5_CAEBE|nr:CBN-SRM-2 protein [Caenorhabditis brenneri]